MSSSISFKRKFFILKKEYSNMRNVNPKGHGKLELRNNRLNISLNIENAENEESYKVILLGPNNLYELGKIHTDNSHGGKVDFGFNYKDIESMGFPLEKINGILILRDTKVLLGAYLDKDDRTIENYIDRLIKTDIKPQAPLREEIVEIEEAAEDEVVFIENDLFIENDSYTENYITPASVTEEEYDRALQEMFKDTDPESDFLDDDVDYIDTEAQRKANQRNQTTNYVLNILSFFPYIEPFKIDLMGYNWWKIAIEDPREDKGFLPYFSYIAGGNHKYPLVQNTVTARALMREHGHYLFGLYNVDEEVKFYLYGVPGEFTIEDHPQRGSTGFNTWFEGKEGIGYWLLYIDPLTGRIIYPINPMIPKD